jgi:hypothetical protein
MFPLLKTDFLVIVKLIIEEKWSLTGQPAAFSGIFAPFSKRSGSNVMLKSGPNTRTAPAFVQETSTTRDAPDTWPVGLRK